MVLREAIVNVACGDEGGDACNGGICSEEGEDIRNCCVCSEDVNLGCRGGFLGDMWSGCGERGNVMVSGMNV